jgi:hypothetical protein
MKSPKGVQRITLFVFFFCGIFLGNTLLGMNASMIMDKGKAPQESMLRLQQGQDERKKLKRARSDEDERHTPSKDPAPMGLPAAQLADQQLPGQNIAMPQAKKEKSDDGKISRSSRETLPAAEGHISGSSSRESLPAYVTSEEILSSGIVPSGQAETLYHCDFCSYKTPHIGKMTSHKRTHIGFMPFVCMVPGCTYKTDNDSDLEKHLYNKHEKEEIAAHEEEWQKALTCKTCHKTYKNPYFFYQHANQEHQEKSWPCTYCTNHFASYQEVYDHTLLEHKPVASKSFEKSTKTSVGLAHIRKPTKQPYSPAARKRQSSVATQPILQASPQEIISTTDNSLHSLLIFLNDGKGTDFEFVMTQLFGAFTQEAGPILASASLIANIREMKMPATTDPWSLQKNLYCSEEKPLLRKNKNSRAFLRTQSILMPPQASTGS